VKRTVALNVGEPAPWFMGRTSSTARFAFHTAAGRYIVLCLFGSASEPLAADVLNRLLAQRDRFDDKHLMFFGVSVDADDERLQRVADMRPGMRYFFDADRSISALYGAVAEDGSYQAHTLVLDPQLRVMLTLPLTQPAQDHVSTLRSLLDRLRPLPAVHRARPQAPVLVVPRIFEPGLCKALIEHYEARGGHDSGFMRDVDGKTVVVVDHKHKRRSDCDIVDDSLIRACRVRVHARLAPEVRKAFQFEATRMERYIVACYDAAESGHFNPHRDNTTLGTAHRRFAVSLFLNPGEYEGGLLRFPEYGNALYGAPVGGAVVFSCSLLHEATTVTKGRRYMFVPFLHDEAAQRVREANAKYLANVKEQDSDSVSRPALDV
jgi:predicted 2-oxoglutarate/Fe(II)-dependent dioxygenase YbiX/peroxiredoxin